MGMLSGQNGSIQPKAQHIEGKFFENSRGHPGGELCIFYLFRNHALRVFGGIADGKVVRIHALVLNER